MKRKVSKVTRYDPGDFPLGYLNDAALLLYEARHWYSLRPEFIERIETFLQSIDWHPPRQTLDKYNRQIARERIEGRRDHDRCYRLREAAHTIFIQARPDELAIDKLAAALQEFDGLWIDDQS